MIPLLLSVAAAAQTPTQVWERTLPIAAPRPYTNALDAVRAVAARADGGVLMIVRAPDGPERLLAIDATGKELFARPLLAPDGLRRPVVRSAAINAEAPDRIWVFLSWESGEEVSDAPVQSQLLSVEPDGVRATTVRLPIKIPPDDGGPSVRNIRVLRRLPDGSLVAGGTGFSGPPFWWYARFTNSGRLLHEAKSRRFPDFIEDAWGNADGGYTLLLVDAEGGRERVTLRRFGADGKQTLRRELTDLEGYHRCAVLVGSMRQMRPQVRQVTQPGQSEPARHTDLVIHEVGKGIVRRVDLGPVDCEDMRRLGEVIVLSASTSDGGQAGRSIMGISVDGDVRWRLNLDATDVHVTPLPDGGAVVVRYQDGSVVRVTRYHAP